MAPVIGSRRHAEFALALEFGNKRKTADWETCGRGASRTAYLHKPTGVVYKVERWDDQSSNRAEYKNARDCSKLEWKRVRIPKVSGFSFKEGGPRGGKAFVIAMEHVKGKFGEKVPKTHYRAARQELYDLGRFEDMHGLNFVVTSDRKIVPIDMGSNRIDKPRGWRTVDDRLLSCGDGRNW